MSKIGVIRTVSEDDYLTERAANPRTGIITPSIHSDNASLVDAPTATKWRRVGDAWVSMGVEQDTPDSSPPTSTYGTETRILQNHDLSANTPKVPCTDSAHAIYTQHKCPKPIPGKRTKPIRTIFDTLSLQRKVLRPRIDDSLPSIQDTKCDRLPVRLEYTSTPMKLRRKVPRSPLSQPRRKRIHSSYAPEEELNDIEVASIAPFVTSGQYRSASTPSERCKYFSPDDVGKDLPSHCTESAPKSESKPTKRSPCSGAFLGLSPGDFIEDIPVQFQKTPDRLFSGRSSTLLPTNAGRFHLPVSKNPSKIGPQGDYPKINVVGEEGSPTTPTSKLHPTSHLHLDVYQGPDHQTMSSSRSLFPPTKIAHHRPIRPGRHHRPTIDTKLLNGLHQRSEIGTIAKGTRHLTNKNRTSVIQTAQYAGTSTSTIITSQIKTENIPQVLSEAPHSRLQVRRPCQPMPILKGEDGGKCVPKVSPQQGLPTKRGILDTKKVKANTGCAISLSRDLERIPMLHKIMVDGAAKFENGSMTENPSQMTIPLSTREDTRGFRKSPTVKAPGTVGHIPTSGTRASQVLSSTVVQRASRGVENECANGCIVSDVSFLGSTNALPDHEDCCPLCCQEDCHNSCLGHDYDSPFKTSVIQSLCESTKSVEKVNGNFCIGKYSHKSSELKPLHLRRTHRTRRHENGLGSFIEIKAEHVADLAQPLQHANKEVTLPEFKAKNTHRVPNNHSTFLLPPVPLPILLSFIESLFIPINAAITWNKHHPELLNLAVLALSKITRMVLHVVEMAGMVRVRWAEYQRSGDVRSDRNGLELLKLRRMVLYESMVIACVLFVTFRVVGQALALVTALWGFGKMVLWILAIGFGSGMLY